MSDVRVLMVDDQEPFRRAVVNVVEEMAGFVMVGAVESGEQSIAAVAELRPDLVLMDVNLPGMDGIQASRRLTSTGSAPVVLLLSTYDENVVDLDGSGAAGYLAKHAFGPQRLRAAWITATART